MVESDTITDNLIINTKEVVSIMEKFLLYMKEHGWDIKWKEKKECNLPEIVKNRYPNIDKKWFAFISCVESVVSQDETTWFLCSNDYNAQNEDSFQWNEWEMISLESAEDDKEWQREIQNFWDKYFPIVMSVKDGYSYYAMSMKDGSIVYGMEPEFEECQVIADSFCDFMQKIVTVRTYGANCNEIQPI